MHPEFADALNKTVTTFLIENADLYPDYADSEDWGSTIAYDTDASKLGVFSIKVFPKEKEYQRFLTLMNN